MAEAHGLTAGGAGSPNSDGRGNPAWQMATRQLAELQAAHAATHRRN
jgi:hypothetical protein